MQGLVNANVEYSNISGLKYAEIGNTYYAKIGGAGGVQVSSMIYHLICHMRFINTHSTYLAPNVGRVLVYKRLCRVAEK